MQLGAAPHAHERCTLRWQTRQYRLKAVTIVQNTCPEQPRSWATENSLCGHVHVQGTLYRAKAEEVDEEALRKAVSVRSPSGHNLNPCITPHPCSAVKCPLV